jgi:hypothetical protein
LNFTSAVFFAARETSMLSLVGKIKKICSVDLVYFLAAVYQTGGQT